MEIITVNLDKLSYPIIIGENILPLIGENLKSRVLGKKILLVANPVVKGLYGKLVEQSIAAAGYTVVWGIIPDGEQFKSLDSAKILYDIAFSEQLDRKCAILALGGGVIGDLAGFVAATYMRGVPFIQVPTTLLAQVDSSVGGKVAVNHPLGKNIIGAFYQPKMVFTDIATLKSLPVREFKAGMAEVIKYGVIWDQEFFDYLQSNIEAINGLDALKLLHIIKTSCAIKAQVVEKDEKEESLRAILNYGHTFGHAYEALTAYKKYLHGEALAVGMVSAALLAVQKNLIDKETALNIENLIKAYGLPVNYTGLNITDIIKKMYSDKKVDRGRIRFILPEKIGRVGIYIEVSDNDIRVALNLQI